MEVRNVAGEECEEKEGGVLTRQPLAGDSDMNSSETSSIVNICDDFSATGRNTNVNVNNSGDNLANRINTHIVVNDGADSTHTGVNNSANRLVNRNSSNKKVNSGGKIASVNKTDIDVNDSGELLVMNSSDDSADISDVNGCGVNKNDGTSTVNTKGTSNVNNSNGPNLSTENDNNDRSGVSLCDGLLDATTQDSVQLNSNTNRSKATSHNEACDEKNSSGEKSRATLGLNRFSFPSLTTMRQKSLDADRSGKPVSHPNGTTPESLPTDKRNKSILHESNHDNNLNYRKKKLSFQITSRSRREHGKQVANGSTPTSNHPETRHGHNRAVQKKLTRRFTFPSLSKMAHTHQMDPREHGGTVDTIIVTDRSSGEPAEAEEESARRPGSREKCCGCGPCSCRVPLPQRLKNWLNRDDTIEGKEIRNTFVVGVAFQLVFTAHFAIQVQLSWWFIDSFVPS